MSCMEFDIPQHPDSRGVLSVLSFNEHIPFEVKRIFTVSQVPKGIVRGGHAHKVCQQFFIVAAGSVKVRAIDKNGERVYELSALKNALHMPSMVWGEQFDYSPDCVLIVLTSHLYDPQDYISHFSEFETAISQLNNERSFSGQPKQM